MLLVIVATPLADIRCERRREFLWLVARDQVHDVIGNQRRKPAHSIACKFQVIGDPHRRGSHDFNLSRVAPRSLSAFLYEAQTPRDEVGVRELENDAVGNSAGEIEYLGSISRDPNRRRTRCPGQARALAVILCLFSRRQRTEILHGLFQLVRCYRLLPQHPARAVATADAKIHPPEIRLSVAKRLDVTVMSRVAGLVTQVPSRIFFVLLAMSVSSG